MLYANLKVFESNVRILVEVPIQKASFAPGTLQIFAGRYSIHRVSPVEGSRDRLVAVLCFSQDPGYYNSPAVQKMFWGRTVERI